MIAFAFEMYSNIYFSVLMMMMGTGRYGIKPDDGEKGKSLHLMTGKQLPSHGNPTQPFGLSESLHSWLFWRFDEFNFG